MTRAAVRTSRDIMKICMDYQPAVVQSAGIGRYTRVLARELSEILPAGDSISLFYFDFRRRAAEGLFPPRTCPVPCRFVPGGVMRRIWRYFPEPYFDRFAGKADVYHFTNFVSAPVRHGASVLTVHDMSFMRYPQFAEARNLRNLRRSLGRSIASASAVITISDFSARETEEFFPCASGKLFPIPLGISPHFAKCSSERISSFRKEYGIDRPFILTVGTVEPRKNQAFLLDVLDRMQSAGVVLVVIGGIGWKSESIISRFEPYISSGRLKWLRHIDDKDLVAAYSGAEAFVMPSFYEGFGFPPLEAMACGVPVVSSPGGSLREVLGDAACVLEGFDADEWAAAVDKVVCDTGLRDALIEKGKKRSSAYSWRRTAELTLKVYGSVVR